MRQLPVLILFLLVAAGRRPPDLNRNPEDPKERLCAMIRHIDWSAPGRLTIMDLMRMYREEDLKRRKKERAQ